ncbi:MAG: hypothetical protein MJ053_03060, partial [Elusimicrobiaceae bacterium]|nr:hypothetical protein [Elusimicrobiaceae bacterium]
DDWVGSTPSLRLTVRKRKVDPIIHGEARTIWVRQKGDTTLLMEENYAAPREICYWFGGKKDAKRGCILE